MTMPSAQIIDGPPSGTRPSCGISRMQRAPARAAAGRHLDQGQFVDFRFDEFEIDLGQHELRRGAEVVPIEPQVFDLLVYLVRNHQRIVSKDELIDAIWQGRAISDAAL